MALGLGLAALLSSIAAGIAVNDATSDKHNKNTGSKKTSYMDATSIEDRVTKYITQGGRPEYQNATSHPKTLSVYNEPYAKKNGKEYGTFEFYKAADGSYTRDLSKIANVSMDGNGKITVTVPDRWANDEQVKKYSDNYMLKSLSGNYKMNKDTEYQDPYDETKKIKTDEFIKKINEALKSRVAALDATGPTIAESIVRFGGTDAKNKVLNGLTTDDIIIMHAKYNKDDSWIPIPKYMVIAYPQIENLETYRNGFVQKKDFLENFYNIESGKITEANAYGIASTPSKMMKEVEDMDPEEVAKTVAFGNFISSVDPKRSGWQQFLQAGDALSRGFYSGFYDWYVGTSDLITNAANFSWANGNTIKTRDFWNGFFGGDATEYLKGSMQDMALTNKDALSKSQAGYAQGVIAGKAIDMFVSLIVVGESSKALSEKITSKITAKGAEKVAIGMAEAGDASKGASVASGSQAAANAAADADMLRSSLSGVANGSARYKAFFSQTWNEAYTLYTKALGGTSAMLQSMSTAQLANTINSAAKIATMANYANTAVNVLGSMVVAAVVSNKDLTTKVLSSEATSDEAKSWVQQVLWDTAKIGAVSWLTNTAISDTKNIYARTLKGTKFDAWARETGQKMSQGSMKFANKISHPWLNFMKWFVNNKAAAKTAAGKTVPNRNVASAEAIKEAVLMNEMRAYGANLSTQPGSYGTQLIEEALEATGTARGVTMSETLDNLARAGVVFDPATLDMSEFEAWQADYAGAQNALTGWNDVSGNVSRITHEFNNPDIQPVISQQLSEVNKANADMLKLEKSEGLLSKDIIKSNKSLLKEDEGFLMSSHSDELARYIVRKYEMNVIANEAIADGVTNLEEYKPYVEARERYELTLGKISKALRDIADKRYIPALMKAERNIVDIMVDDGVFSREFVEAMRSGNSKYGKNGEYWMRLVARRDMPKGTYSPFSKTTQQDNTIALNRFRIMDDADITWPGNGLFELITEYAESKADKDFLEISKKTTGLRTEVKVSGKETSAAGKMKEYKPDFESAIKRGISSFKENVEGTTAIGPKRAIQQKEFYDQVAILGGVQTIDIDTLRVLMQDNNVPMADSIVDQESLDKFLAGSSEEAKKIILGIAGEKTYGKIVSDYVEKSSFEVLKKRKKIADIDDQIANFKKNSDAYTAGINYGKMDLSSAPESGRENIENFIQKKIEDGKAAAIALGYKGKPEKFEAWSEKKLASMNKKRNALIDQVLDKRGTKRPTIKFNGDIYGTDGTTFEYVKKRSDRQKISDDILGPWNGVNGNELSQRWLVDEDVSAKDGIRKAIESNPKLHSATLSTMYDNSGSELSFDEWLDTPITLKRQQKIDSLRPEDAFLSFSMNEGWTGTNDPDPDGSALTGDIITLEVKPKNTLGQIPQNIDNEGEAEVLVPREVYATAMSDYNQAMKSGEMKQFNQLIKGLEDEIAERSPVENAQEFIPTLSYQQRKELAQKVVDNGEFGEYTILYRMQGGTPDKWRPNNRGQKGKFIGNVGELEGAVWLTSDPEWVEGPQRATAGVKTSPQDSGEEVTDDNIVVIPVRKADILDNVYDGGEEYKNDEVLRSKIEENGKKIIQTRATERDEVVSSMQEKGIPPRYMDHTNPANASETEFILFEQDHPEVLTDGMDLMLQEYNKQFDNRNNKRAIDRIQREIDETKEGIDLVLENAIKNEQFNKLYNFKNDNLDKYEVLMTNVDRANAANNQKIKDSDDIAKAAEIYRNSVDELRDSIYLTEEFSYLAKLPAARGSIQAFAEKNGIEIPEGKGSVKSKVKSALWQKILDGEKLPSINGLKKSAIKDIADSVKILTSAEETPELVENKEAMLKGIKSAFYRLLDSTELFQNPSGANPYKYALDTDTLRTDIDDAIDSLINRVKANPKARLAVEGMVEYKNANGLNNNVTIYGEDKYAPTETKEARFEFAVLSELLSKEGQKTFGPTITKIAENIVDDLIPKNKVIIKGNNDDLYKKVEGAINDRLESRYATVKVYLESAGESAQSSTITELLEKHAKNIGVSELDPLVVKTTDANGNIQYEQVSPAIANLYNERPIYTPMSTPMKLLADVALLKKITTTDLSLRSFSKQSVSDPALGFATVGALPGTLELLREEISATFGSDILRAMATYDPLRYKNIQTIAQREGISELAALSRNEKALAVTQVPFSLLSKEMLRQANASKYGSKAAIARNKKDIAEKINSGLRKVSDKLSLPQNKRETYFRLVAGETAYLKALRKGYSVAQASAFREHAINTATTNFRLKHTVLNGLRSTVPYLTSGISGTKSFWRMFELDPVGVTSRIFTGFIVPILYFMGEIFSDEDLRKKYEALAESEKSNHIVIAVGGELILIPVGEELGQYTNLANHIVEAMYDENQYSFWNLMLNDIVNLIPGPDLTGFTDPEMLEPLTGETPNFLGILDNGIARVLSTSMPPLAQSLYMANTGRDLYTGRRVDTSYVTIDEDGNPKIMSTSTSQFAKAMAGVFGGDARVIEKVVSGLSGPTFMHVLDTITSAVQYVGTGGQEGSLTTGVDKALESLAKPFTAVGYNDLDRRFNSAVSDLFRRKEEIEKDRVYIKYNEEISKESDPKKRQNLISKRNDLFTEYLKTVENLVKNYRKKGGSLDKLNFSKVVSLITFEDAVRADREFMELHTDWSDAYKQAMQTLYNMGIKNPDGPSSLGYIYTDKNGNPQLAMWTPTQMQIINDTFYQQGDIHTAHIKAIIDDGTETSIKKKKQAESDAEQPYWDKYNATGKLSNAEWDAIDNLRKAFNAEVVLALNNYMKSYGAANVLSNDAVIDYLEDVIKVPSSYEKINGRNVSSGGGKLDKQSGFAESYIKTIFGVK